jgi:hypothetical protein
VVFGLPAATHRFVQLLTQPQFVSGRVLSIRPLRDVPLELIEVFVLGEACLVEEGDSILHTDDLDLLVLHHLISHLCLLYKVLPNDLLKCLIGIGGVRELRLEPVTRGSSTLLGYFVDVSHSFQKDLVVSLDRSDTVVIAVEKLSAGFVQLSEAPLCLAVLVDQHPKPAVGVPDLNSLLCRFAASVGLFVVDRVADQEYLNVRRDYSVERHFEKGW